MEARFPIVDWDGGGRDDILTAGFTGLHVYKLGKDGRQRQLLPAHRHDRRGKRQFGERARALWQWFDFHQSDHEERDQPIPRLRI
jgi:hypothetical protein